MVRSDRRGWLQPKLRIVGLPRALRLRCLRGTFPPRLHYALAFLLADFGEEIGQNSWGSGSRFRGERRYGVLAGLNRLRVSEPTEEPFGLSPCLALCSRVREVLVDTTLGHIVPRDKVNPIILAGGG
jgi:hypothetical protein